MKAQATNTSQDQVNSPVEQLNEKIKAGEFEPAFKMYISLNDEDKKQFLQKDNYSIFRTLNTSLHSTKLFFIMHEAKVYNLDFNKITAAVTQKPFWKVILSFINPVNYIYTAQSIESPFESILNTIIFKKTDNIDSSEILTKYIHHIQHARYADARKMYDLLSDEMKNHILFGDNYYALECITSMGNFEAVEWAFLARTRNPNKKAEILKFKDYTFLSHVISNSDMQDITKYFELVDKLNQNSNSSKKQDQNKKPLLDLTDVFTKISFVCLTKLSSSQDYCDKFEWFIVNAEKNKADLKTALLKTDNGSLLQNYIRNKHYSCLNLIFDKFPEIKEEVSKLPNYKTDIEPFLNIPKPIEVPVAEADDLTKSFRGLTESLEQNKDSSRCLVM